jgi:hypothetical protein
MDPATLALAVSAIHFMGPYLKNVGEAASKKMGEKLFDLFYTRFSTHPEVKTNLDQLRSDPYKDQNQSNAAARLGTLLDTDPKLADLVRRYLESPANVHIEIEAGDNANIAGQVYGNADFSRHGKSS